MSEPNKSSESNTAAKERIQGFSEIEEAITRVINEHGPNTDSAEKTAGAASNSR